MNVYDFDGTIYNGDSSVDFYVYCLIKKPIIIKKIPSFFADYLRYKMKKINKTELKSSFFSFVKYLPDVDKYVIDFWKTKKGKIKKWYLNNKKYDDVIISASPYFLLKEATKLIGIDGLIASEVDKFSGKFLSVNCYGKEKQILFNNNYPDAIIDEFYSDSKSDLPMAKMAKRAFLIKGKKIIEWNNI